MRKRMYICMCDWVTLLYSRKLTDHCKPVIMEKIKIIKKSLSHLKTPSKLMHKINHHRQNHKYIEMEIILGSERMGNILRLKPCVL